jgi:hypothetical protein
MTDTMSAEEYRLIHAKTEKHKAQGTRMKFGNTKVKIDGITFDSKKEAKYYGLYKLLVATRELKSFEVHKVYPLEVNGVLVCKYVADFVLYYPNGKITVVDIKGDATAGLAVFRIKKQLMKAVHGLIIHVIN